MARASQPTAPQPPGRAAAAAPRSPAPAPRANIAAMAGYQPGAQPRNDRAIKLNANENPHPPAPAVARALAEFDAGRLRRYPAPLADGFRAAAARLHRVAPEQVIATNGGDELLRLALTTFVNPGEAIAYAEPSYSLYPVLAAIHDCEPVAIPLDHDFALPEDFISQLREANARLLLLVNPHAPSGGLLDTATLDAIASAFPGLILLDEAYVDFIAPERAYDSPRLLGDHGNILILRTLSKGHSLAGLRFGYGLGSAEVIAPMQGKTRDSYNTDALSQELAEAALADLNYAQGVWREVRAARETLAAALRQFGWQVWPSEANFLLARVPPPHRARELCSALGARDILVRHFDTPRLGDCLRISIGTARENQALLAALGEVLGNP